MAPHFVFVRGTPSQTSAAAKRQQGAGGTATATTTNGKKKQGQGNGKKKGGAVPSTAVAAPTENGKGRKRRSGKKAARKSPCATVGQPGEIMTEGLTCFPQEQQQVLRPLQAPPPQGTSKRPTLRPPVLGRKPEPSSPPQPTPTSRQHSFSSSASTLVASNAGTPYLSPALSPNNLIQQSSTSPTIPPKINKKPAIPFRPAQPNRKVADPTTSDPILAKLSSVLTSIDGEAFSGKEDDLDISQYDEAVASSRPRGGFVSNGNVVAFPTDVTAAIPKQPPKKANLFTKVHLYANARLPPNLPLFKVPLPLYPMICLAAQYSRAVYQRPTGPERETHIGADWRMGTKAMVLKSIPVDNMNVIVFAIRGTHTFMDWAVNLHSAPTPPQDFLDDPGNLCHSGFLSVARRMIRPVAARLQALLEEDPARSSCSLVLTGHSAGGAVASLLYAHMVARNAKSELKVLAQYFKRIHCFTFGAPPVSLLPLRKPDARHLQSSTFLSFINEGDPVPRADKEYVRSLIDLYASCPPSSPSAAALAPPPRFRLFRSKKRKPDNLGYMPINIWQPPPGTLSNAGKLVVLRRGPSGNEEDLRACATNDEQLRSVMFGDPVMHMMRIYSERLETLATKAVTGRM